MKQQKTGRKTQRRLVVQGEIKTVSIPLPLETYYPLYFFLFNSLLKLNWMIFLFWFTGLNRESASEMYAAVDKSLLKENTTKAVLLVTDNTHEKGIWFLWTQIYHQLRYISLVLIFVFIYITIPLWSQFYHRSRCTTRDRNVCSC